MDSRAYRSKIGRLPWAVRNELCERMRDGGTGAELLEWLNATPEARVMMAAAGCGPVNDQNLSVWRGTGYQAWLDDQERAERMRKLAQTAEAIAGAAGGDPGGVGCRIATARILDVLEDPEQDPKQLADMANALARIRAGDADEVKAALAKEKNEIAKKQLALSVEKFRRETCELFLKWQGDRKAAAIADGPGTNAEKVKALLAYMDEEEAQAAPAQNAADTPLAEKTQGRKDARTEGAAASCKPQAGVSAGDQAEAEAAPAPEGAQ